MPGFTRNATGDPIATDTRMVVLQMNSCPSSGAEIAEEFQANKPLKARGGKWHRFARREIIITRNDFLRTNIYYRSYEASRWAVNYVRYRKRKASETRALLAEYGPGGLSPAEVPHLPGLAVQTLR